MNIQSFAAALAKKIDRSRPDARLANEAAFERRHVIPPAWELSRKHPEIRVFCHPEKLRTSCSPSCAEGMPEFRSRARGCHKCWSASKERSVVDAFGTRHNFDLVAVDPRGHTLAVEVKWLRFTKGKGPNGEFQRFIGQCVLAAARNHAVIGVCGFSGRRIKQFDAHERKATDLLKTIGVQLVLLRASS